MASTPTPGMWQPGFDYDNGGRSQPHLRRPQQEQEARRPRPRRHCGPRKCRICLEEVQPTFDTPTGLASSFMRPSSEPRYVSADPELGRLMSPCLCKGSQKYVHEGCLEAWRHASAGHSARNLWKCPTCGFQYRMSRLSIGRILGHWFTNVGLTIAAVLFIMFILGFIGDKIVDFYLDPWGFFFYSDPQPQYNYYRTKDDIAWDRAWKKVEESWSFHFVKGFMSLGVIGFVKTMLASSPLYYFNLGGYRRRRGDGRDRYMDLSWTVVVIGAVTFVWAVWKAVRHLTKRALDRVKENIVDVQTDEDEEDEEEANDAAGNSSNQGQRPGTGGQAAEESKKDR